MVAVTNVFAEPYGLQVSTLFVKTLSTRTETRSLGEFWRVGCLHDRVSLVMGS